MATAAGQEQGGEELLLQNQNCKKKLFATSTSPASELKSRSIDTIRARRKRYRQKKKDKIKGKEKWEIRLEEELCNRWRERRINYEKEDNEEKQSSESKKETEKKLEEKCHQEEKHKKIELNHQTKLYSQEARKTVNSGITTLLLPAVSIPEKSHESSKEIKEKLPILSDLSGVDSVSVISYIQSIEDKEAKALHLAKHYRDLAERMRNESLKKQFAMEEKFQLIRGFWRNQIKEGSSRAGLIVQKALQQKQHT